MFVTGTHINYYFICHRKLWLFSNGITMEHASDLVYEGKMIHETTYPDRSSKYEEVQIGGAKVDFYDAKEKVIHEIKKSDKIEDAHEFQLKFYIWTFESYGILGVTGILEYPKLRRRTEVYLSDKDRMELQTACAEIEFICMQDLPPECIEKPICKNCAYFEFCFIHE